MPGFPAFLAVEISYDEVAASTRTWYDLTPFCLAFSAKRSGRQYDTDQTQPGTCTLTLENTDGRFDPGYSAIGNVVRVNRMIRIRAGGSSGTAATLWTGYIDSYTRSWPGGYAQSVTEITATDVMKFYARQSLVGVFRPAESTGARIQALTGGSTDIVGTDSHGLVDTTYDKDNQLNEIQALAMGSGGLWYINGTGQPLYQTPSYRANNPRANTPQCGWVFGKPALTTSFAYPDVEVGTDVAPRLDDSLLATQVTVTDGLGADHTVTSYAISSYGLVELSLQTRLTAVAASSRASELLARREAPNVRIDSVTLDALTDDNSMAEALRRELSDRVRLRIGGVHDTQGGTGWTSDVFVESIAHDVDFQNPQWKTTFQVSPV